MLPAARVWGLSPARVVSVVVTLYMCSLGADDGARLGGGSICVAGAWVFYKTEPAPGSTKTEISSVPYKNTRIFYRERTILPVLVCV